MDIISKSINPPINQQINQSIYQSINLFFSFTDLKASDINYSKDNETATIIFSSDLPTGNGNLHLDFTGELNDKMKGFYRSKYTDDGKEKHCAVTQFEVMIQICCKLQ